MPAPNELFMSYSPDVFAFKQADVYVCEVRIDEFHPSFGYSLVAAQSRIQRRKPFVVPQFEALKALTSPEVQY